MALRFALRVSTPRVRQDLMHDSLAIAEFETHTACAPYECGAEGRQFGSVHAAPVFGLSRMQIEPEWPNQAVERRAAPRCRCGALGHFTGLDYRRGAVPAALAHLGRWARAWRGDSCWRRERTDSQARSDARFFGHRRVRDAHSVRAV